MTNAVATLSAAEVCDRALTRARSVVGRAAMITVTTQRARREADRSDGRRRRGALRSPLDGVPVVWKDLFDVADTITTCGSAALFDRPPAAADSALVRRMGALGMVTLGKTNLSEFAFSGLGINRRFGTPVNPVDPALVPGGSSSGAAVAVAAGIAAVAVGTDTSGSVRVPAAFCGCVGFRASHERYGRNDFHALSPTLDSVGFIARAVDDIRLLDRLVRDIDEVAAPSTIRAVIADGEWIDDCTPGVRAAFDTAVHLLREHGVQFSKRRLPSLQRAQDLIDAHGTIVGADAYSIYGHLLSESADIEPATRRRLARNAEAATSVMSVRRAMSALRRQFTEELGDAVLLCPTVRHEPPRIDDLLACPERYDAANASTLRTTMVLSYLGTCGVTLPLTGRSPTGLLLSASAGHDSRLLAITSSVAAMLGPLLRGPRY